MVSVAGFIYTVLGFFIILGLVAVTVIINYMKSNRLVVRIPTSGNSFIDGVYWTRSKKDRETNTVWWHSVFWQRKIKIQEPPSKCMDVTRRGKKWVEVYRISEDEYIFCKDPGINANVVLEESGKMLSSVFKPFSVVERETIINQYKKANAEKPVDRVSQIISLVPAILMGMIIIVAIIYSGEIARSINSVQNGAASMTEKAAKLYQDAVGGAKQLTGEVKGGVAQAGESPPR